MSSYDIVRIPAILEISSVPRKILVSRPPIQVFVGVNGTTPIKMDKRNGTKKFVRTKVIVVSFTFFRTVK